MSQYIHYKPMDYEKQYESIIGTVVITRSDNKKHTVLDIGLRISENEIRGTASKWDDNYGGNEYGGIEYCNWLDTGITMSLADWHHLTYNNYKHEVCALLWIPYELDIDWEKEKTNMIKKVGEITMLDPEFRDNIINLLEKEKYVLEPLFIDGKIASCKIYDEIPEVDFDF